MSTPPNGCPACPACGVSLAADCPRATCDWLADPDFPIDWLDDEGNVLPEPQP